jgi:predicted AAA+ superfamily ATPase
MIDRVIYKDLINWKNNSTKKPLLIRGARQVGKSFIVRQFGEREFKNIIEINFERSPEYKAIFSSFKPNEILEKMKLLLGADIISGDTLLFLDEIQECVEAIQALRYFHEEIPELHIIGAGSLFEFALNKIKIPVGRIQYLYMYPLSFIEFVAAVENEKLRDYILDISNLKKIDKIIHNKLLELVRKFFLIGGMPEVVQNYIDKGGYENIFSLQSSLIETFMDDFGKYSKHSEFKQLEKVFYGASSLVGEKFVYSKIDQSSKIKEVKKSLDLLDTAGLLKRVYKTIPEGLPLEAHINLQYFKIIMLDVGLFSNISGIRNELIKEKDLSTLFRGAIAEQFVGQELINYQANYTKARLYYWARDAKNSSAEVDYLIEKKSKIIPIEVKAGSTGMMRSLKMLIKKYNLDAIRISKKAYTEEDRIISIPFYGISAYLNSI